MRLAITFILPLLILGCAPQAGENMKKVSFKTNDGITIVGNYWNGSEKGVLLLHMMPATKESWNEFAAKLSRKGYSVLAIDLRGHGESNEGGKLDFRKFSDAEHQLSKQDVEAGAEFLRKNGVSELYLSGASIGANLALGYQANHPEVKKSILLSPGTNYRGIQTIPYAKQLKGDQMVFIVGGNEDNDSEAMINKIAEDIEGEKIVRILDGSAHGTNLIDAELMDELAGWIGGTS